MKRILALAAVLVLVVSALALGDTEFRGVNVVLENADRPTLEYLVVNWGANLVRVALHCGADWTYFIPDADLPTAIPERDWERLDQLLDDSEELGLRVVICLHQWEGYEYIEGAADDSLWTDRRHQQSMIDFWRSVATRYSGRGDVIYGYDILNEPGARFNWRIYSTALWVDIAESVTAAIREVDTDHAVIVETPNYGYPTAFDGFAPIHGDNVVYSFHLWQPESFTQQGHPGIPSATYPDNSWNKDALRSLLKGAAEFQESYGVPVFAGEIGVSATADPASRAAYFADALSLFEEFGFDYCLWSYSETPMKSLEHGPWLSEGALDVCYSGTTEALSVFLDYLSQNAEQQLPPRSLPTCLFDESGWEVGSRETKIAADLLWKATRVLDVTEHSGPLTADDVDVFDVVVIGGERPSLNESETDLLVEYVRQGGGLLFHGALHVCRGIESLLGAFGIQATEGLVLSSDAVDGSVGRYWCTLSSEHEICDGVVAYLANWGVGMSTESTADTVVWTPASSWIDRDNDRTHDASEPTGPMSLVVAREFGAGRLVVMSD